MARAASTEIEMPMEEVITSTASSGGLGAGVGTLVSIVSFWTSSRYTLKESEKHAKNMCLSLALITRYG